ncbi:hypothetical protein [Halomonas caseinilytica]|uniref:hypothetical protein n=1 Tax=Halomonas caseinilytica TaxID=438744 RepID=UPI000848AEC7|nr:hypothetical protein [Halomonas caseinilytica]
MQLGIALYNALRSADVSDEKAMDVVNALESEMNQHLATKHDLKQEISQLETRLTVRIGGMIAGSVGVLSIVMAVLKVFG